MSQSAPLFLEFVYLMSNSYLILTDSGGVQEEAPSLNIPVLVARDKTERPEGIKAGSSILVGRNKENIKHTIKEFIYDKSKYNRHSNIPNPYGDGTTAEKVIQYFLGHEDISTVEIYTHINLGETLKAIKKHPIAKHMAKE